MTIKIGTENKRKLETYMAWIQEDLSTLLDETRDGKDDRMDKDILKFLIITLNNTKSVLLALQLKE